MTFDDWLGEMEGFSVRAERIPAEALEWARAAWDTSRAASLEDAAKAVEAEAVGQDGSPINDPTDISYNYAIEHAAAAIRAIKTESQG